MTSTELELKIKITDRETLNRVRSENLEGYLASKGWRPHGESPQVWRSWRKGKKKGRDIEIIAPLDRTYADYAERIYDAVAILAETEKRSQMKVLDDLGVLVSPLNVIARISNEARSIAKAGKKPTMVYLDNATVWEFGRLSEDQTGPRFQKVLAEKGPRSALEKAFGGYVSGLKIVFDADRFHVE